MTTGQTPPSPRPGAADTDDIETGVEQPPETLGETVEALSPQADAKGQLKQKVAGTKDRLTEKAYKTKAAAAEKAHTAQSTARGTVTDLTGLVKPRVPIVAVIAAAVVISVIVWRRR